jgi:cyclophilin family peptidyl-prolyl cis-trans isomerase
MVQGGGLDADMEPKRGSKPIRNEAANGLKNLRGTVAMARTGSPHTATAQFYINTVDNKALDHRDLSEEGYGYCVFGRVVSGMEFVDKIEKVKTEWRKGQSGVPQYAVRIKDALLLPPQ